MLSKSLLSTIYMIDISLTPDLLQELYEVITLLQSQGEYIILKWYQVITLRVKNLLNASICASNLCQIFCSIVKAGTNSVTV